jgi:hypothetical protein
VGRSGNRRRAPWCSRRSCRPACSGFRPTPTSLEPVRFWLPALWFPGWPVRRSVHRGVGSQGDSRESFQDAGGAAGVGQDQLLIDAAGRASASRIRCGGEGRRLAQRRVLRVQLTLLSPRARAPSSPLQKASPLPRESRPTALKRLAGHCWFPTGWGLAHKQPEAAAQRPPSSSQVRF